MANISDLLLKNKTHAKIFNHAANVGKKLNTPIYIVGGYVRDLILGKELKDIDLMVEKNSDIFAKNLAKKLSINKVVKLFTNWCTNSLSFSDWYPYGFSIQKHFGYHL